MTHLNLVICLWNLCRGTSNDYYFCRDMGDISFIFLASQSTCVGGPRGDVKCSVNGLQIKTAKPGLVHGNVF